jgi:DNA uptake protein ComE-like DNA-binding protein
MSDSTYGKISTQIETANASLKKIALNVADEKTIATHPYIGWRNAKLIVRYRQAHGAYMTIEQLESVWALEKTKLDRLLPYLSFDSIASSK